MSNVFAVILSYNRSDLLRQCLGAVLNQTVPCARVIVVDNGSTDGTLEMLANDFATVDVVRVKENKGAAYGFSLGMRTAVRAGADLVWVMDDDVVAAPQALEALTVNLQCLESQSKFPPFMLSVARSPEGALTNVPEIDRSRNMLDYQLWPESLDKGLAPITRATFVSILIPARTFMTFGYPMASMYIWGEDTEYTMRITKKNPGFLVGSSKVVHIRAQSGRIDISREKSPHRLPWYKYHVRNTIYSNFKHRSLSSGARYVWTTLVDGARQAFSGHFRQAYILLTGIAAALVYQPNDSAPDSGLPNTPMVISDSLAQLIVGSQQPF